MTEKTKTIRQISKLRKTNQFHSQTDFAGWFFSLVLFLLLFQSGVSFAVEKHTLSGYVRDAESNEEIIAASVYAIDTKSGMSTNVYGFYSLTLPADKYTIRFSSVGYDPVEVSIDFIQDTRMDIVLPPLVSEIGSIVVTGKRKYEEARQVKMGATKISTSQAQFIPVLLGEQDILKTIQLLPGVQEAGEGGIGFHVRGGGSDQNLVLLDEATVFNSGHMLGFFSVFNSDAIKDAILIKGSGSAKYGGRLSSVLDIKMKEGNSKRFHSQAGIGLIASRFAIEGPIKVDRGSFMISGRRTYFDLFLKLSSDEDVRNSQLFFYDLNIKANYHTGMNDRVFLSGYFGKDVLAFSDDASISWGNATGTIRWNHIFNNRLFLNSSLIYSRYIYKIGIFSGNELVDISSFINTISLKEDFNYFVDHRNTFGFGGQVAYYTILPGEIEAEQGTVNDQKLNRRFALESAVYANHEWNISSNLSVDYGLRLSSR